MNISKVLYYIVPGFYTFRTRIYPEGFRGFKFHSYGYFITIFPLIVMHIYNVIHYLLLLVIGFLQLYMVYEIFYVINDFISVKHEDAPTYRSINISININFFYILRITMLLLSIEVSLFLKHPYTFDAICTLITLSLIEIIYNNKKMKLARIPTHAALRCLRFSYPSLYAIGLKYLPSMIIALFPFIILDEISYYSHIMRKLYPAFNTPIPKIPLYYRLLEFLPFQLLLLFALDTPYFISGVLGILFISIIKKFLDRRTHV
ncbi:MAG: hypothetical protein QXM43_01085 [Desulfurococcaceae archaeon]